MKKNLSLTMVCILSAGLFFISAAQTKSITVTGTVVDSTTGSPVPQAMILLFDTSTLNIDLSNLGALKLDTAFSGTDGKFQYQMTVNTLSFILGYGVLKEGYLIKYSASGFFPTSTTVNLGTITISKIDTSVKNTLTVSGTVVDSATGNGIGGALVIMSTGGGFDTTGNTVLTNNDGTFSKQVIISELNGASVVSYIITDPDYQTKLGQNTATGKQLDLGRILMERTTAAIKPAGLSMARAQANRMSVYALNGRLLYDGRILPLDKIAQCRCGEVIVALACNNLTISVKKMLLKQ
ncbi:MAG: hypothetical protein WBM07_05620 [Chitinivibrionales bacterium]